MGFYCECGKIGDWHASNLQGDAWRKADAKRDGFKDAGKKRVFIVNTECISATDNVLESGDGWAIVEDLS